MATSKYDKEIEKAEDDLFTAQERLRDAEERLLDAEEVLANLRRNQSQQEDISFNLPSLSGCTLFYSPTGGTVLSQNGEEIIKWNYIPSLSEVFEVAPGY